MYWKSGTSDLLVLMLFVLQCTNYKYNFLTLTLTYSYYPIHPPINPIIFHPSMIPDASFRSPGWFHVWTWPNSAAKRWKGIWRSRNWRCLTSENDLDIKSCVLYQCWIKLDWWNFTGLKERCIYIWTVNDMIKIKLKIPQNHIECTHCDPGIHICVSERGHYHYSDVIMGAMAYQITNLTVVYSTVYSGADQRK